MKWMGTSTARRSKGELIEYEMFCHCNSDATLPGMRGGGYFVGGGLWFPVVGNRKMTVPSHKWLFKARCIPHIDVCCLLQQCVLQEKNDGTGPIPDSDFEIVLHKRYVAP